MISMMDGSVMLDMEWLWWQNRRGEGTLGMGNSVCVCVRRVELMSVMCMSRSTSLCRICQEVCWKGS